MFSLYISFRVSIFTAEYGYFVLPFRAEIILNFLPK